MPTGGETFDDYVNLPLTLQSNRYFSTGDEAFRIGPDIMQFQQWQGSVSDVGSTWGQVSFPSPDRTIATYMASLGRTPSLEEFLAEARQQSKANWHPELNGPAVVDYFRLGFGLAPIGNYGACPADINGDGVLNLNDMVAFQKYYFHNDMRADVNHDGVLSVQDFSAFQSLFNAGCP